MKAQNAILTAQSRADHEREISGSARLAQERMEVRRKAAGVMVTEDSGDFINESRIYFFWS